ncbi:MULTISPECIES: hemolysin family protein [unclassified Planococcus (in: firmicutes)]|uniref:hemolysin family protein n=1 Tax=unclassified Planococcus (in: firmicutes) TaxID=2662419 RepID=UPI0020B20E63|nr:MULTISPECIES: hemolysin family protein [unclassified Planococcus (in: firmicutes)]
MGWALGVLSALIFANALFAASEIALISLNDYKIKKMAESGNKKAQLIDAMLSQPSQFLATIQIGITLAGFLASAFAADSFADELSLYVQGTALPVSPGIVQITSLIFITLLLSYFTLVFGELVPKRLALQKPQPIAMAMIYPLRAIAVLTSPFVTILSWSTNGVIRLFGIDPHQPVPEETEEEIRLMLEAGKEKGTIEDMEQFIITRAFEFNDKAIGDIMVHRTDIIAISVDDSLDDIVSLATLHPFSKFPVYQDNRDQMIGSIHLKDLFRYRENPPKPVFDIRQIMRAPHFVFERRKIDEVFLEMQKSHNHLAIVLDEYGGTAGLITLEDLLEELVGDIQSEDKPST